MPLTTSIGDCRRFADTITSVGGTVPDALGHLLSVHALLARQGSFQDPAAPIIDAALAGSLDEKSLAKLLPAAAAAAQTNTYRLELATRSEHTLVGEFHRQLKDGGADAILNSLRPKFDGHAEAIAYARSLISSESTAEHVIASGAPELVTAWQGLDGHIRAVNAIAAVASQFGCRPTASFPQIVEYVGAGSSIDDRALMCTSGDLVTDSALFGRPDQGHRTSPWFRTSLKLHSIAQARARHDQWAADRWDGQHSGPQESWIDEHGQAHQKPRPKNPYRPKVAAT